MAATTQSNGSVGSRSNYQRLVTEFGPNSIAKEGLPTVSDARPFQALEVYNKVAILVGITMAAGVVSALLKPGPGVIFISIFAALGCALGGMFSPRRAKFLAPAFSVFEGIALGSMSSYYAGAGNQAVVPMAIIGTSVVFIGVLIAYRSGLIKVGPAFLKATMIAGLGLLAMMLASMFGLQLPFTSSAGSGLIIFGYLYLVVAVMDLFVDFAYVDQAQKAGVSEEGEWFAALSITVSLVMVYMALLNILGRR